MGVFSGEPGVSILDICMITIAMNTWHIWCHIFQKGSVWSGKIHQDQSFLGKLPIMGHGRLLEGWKEALEV